MTSALLYELARLVRTDAEHILAPYAWPPRGPLTADERREYDRLEATSRAIRYRGDVAAFEEQL